MKKVSCKSSLQKFENQCIKPQKLQAVKGGEDAIIVDEILVV